jgi:hypothetical protein
MTTIIDALASSGVNPSAMGIGAGGGEAGGMGGLANLLQNKLFLQYLSSAGGALSKGDPAGGALDAVTQQNISSQNFAKLLAKMLSGNVPEGGAVKMTDKGLSLNVPQSMLSQSGFSGLGAGSGKDGGGSTPNPFL